MILRTQCVYPNCRRMVRLPAKHWLCRLHKAVRAMEARKVAALAATEGGK